MLSSFLQYFAYCFAKINSRIANAHQASYGTVTPVNDDYYSLL
jgi:hypothetical protein